MSEFEKFALLFAEKGQGAAESFAARIQTPLHIVYQWETALTTWEYNHAN